MPNQTVIPNIIRLHREQFLTRDETRIRTVANQPAMQAIPSIKLHLTALLFAEEIEDIHAAAATNYARREIHHRSELHDGYKAMAHQLYLFHLDRLHHLISQ